MGTLSWAIGEDIIAIPVAAVHTIGLPLTLIPPHPSHSLMITWNNKIRLRDEVEGILDTVYPYSSIITLSLFHSFSSFVLFLKRKKCECLVQSCVIVFCLLVRMRRDSHSRVMGYPEHRTPSTGQIHKRTSQGRRTSHAIQSHMEFSLGNWVKSQRICKLKSVDCSQFLWEIVIGLFV